MGIGLGGLFFTEYSVYFMLIATFIDLFCQFIQSKWNEFEKEFLDLWTYARKQSKKEL